MNDAITFSIFNDQTVPVGGDFNNVINLSLEKLNGTNDTNKLITFLIRLMS